MRIITIMVIFTLTTATAMQRSCTTCKTDQHTQISTNIIFDCAHTDTPLCVSCLAHALSDTMHCPCCHARVSDAGKRWLITHTPNVPADAQTKRALHQYLQLHAPLPPCGVSAHILSLSYRQLNTHPTELHLNEQGLTHDTLAALIYALTPQQRAHIARIRLAHNQLEALPEALTLMPHLQAIFAQHNPLKSVDTVSMLAHLQELSLDFCQIRALPTNFGALHELAWLSLAYNPITDLPESFADLECLRELSIAHTPLCACAHARGLINQLELVTPADNE